MTGSGMDDHWMQRALTLARKGAAVCSPNPMVGCVVLDKLGFSAGEGWHEFDALDHAEVVALAAAKARAKGGTAFVTLEPCNHTGRTGPCTEALIGAGIARVVVATLDPNPLMAGKSIERLREAGIEVTVGVAGAQARQFNEGFARWIQHRRPFVALKVAMTLDGRIAPAPESRHERAPYWITCEASRAAVQQLRWQHDAILTGVDTVIADDPLLTDRSGNRRRRPLLRVVVDSALRIPVDSKLLSTAEDDLVIFTVSRDQSRIAALEGRGARIVALETPDSGPDAGRVPLGAMMDWLGSKQILSILAEPGARLGTALIAASLVDRMHLFSSPQLMGADAIPAFRGLNSPILLRNAEISSCGDDLSITALLRDPWAISASVAEAGSLAPENPPENL